jgi:hypothetical protein
MHISVLGHDLVIGSRHFETPYWSHYPVRQRHVSEEQILTYTALETLKVKILKTFAIEEINFSSENILFFFFIVNALLKINLQTYFCLLCLLSYCVSCFSILYTLEFWHRLFHTYYFLLQVSTVQFHLSERTESRTGRLALCLSSFTIVGTVPTQDRRIK